MMWGIIEGMEAFDKAQRDEAARRRRLQIEERDKAARKQLADGIRDQLKPFAVGVVLTIEEALLIADFLER